MNGNTKFILSFNLRIGNELALNQEEFKIFVPISISKSIHYVEYDGYEQSKMFNHIFSVLYIF